MKTHSFKRWIAGLLSAALCLSAFLGLGITKAFAKGEQAEVCLVSFPREGDANYSTTTWGHDDIKLMNGWFFQKGKYLTVYSISPVTKTALHRQRICLTASTPYIRCQAGKAAS